MLPQENRDETIKKKIAGLKKIFAKTKFGSVDFIPISANIGAS